MFTFTVLALNLVALAGIAIGLLLRAPRVRNALEVAYIHSSDIAQGHERQEVIRTLVSAFTRTVALNDHHHLSIWKLIVVSFISSLIFSVAMAPIIGDISPSDPAAKFFGGGTFGTFAGTILFYVFAWPGHFIYDFFICWILLKVSKSSYRRSLRRHSLYMLLALGCASLAPIAVVVLYVLFRFVLTGLPTTEMTEWDLILIGIPFFWNGPTFSWLSAAHLILDIKIFEFITTPRAVLFLLSTTASASIGFFDLFARCLAASKRAMSLLATLTIRLTKADADRIFNYSWTAFSVGNGLCQLFGISIKLN